MTKHEPPLRQIKAAANRRSIVLAAVSVRS
jgi:hypothetical protein